MKTKKNLFLPMLAFVLLMTVTSPGGSLAKSPTNMVVFEGQVNGSDLAGKFLEYYVNHIEQNFPVPLVMDTNGNYFYHVAIPLNIFPAGSTVTFKIDDQVYGFATLLYGKHLLNLSMDEQSH
jgi:hypothetical protein